MKKTIALVLFLLALVWAAVSGCALTADSEECFYYVESDGEVTIKGLAYGYDDADVVLIPSAIGGNPVISIGDWAFNDKHALTKIVIPDSVTRIGGKAFYGCSALEEIDIPDSVTSIGEQAFLDCSALTKVHIPNGITNIGDHVFQKCSALTKVELPNSVTRIGSYAFSGCNALAEIALPPCITSIEDWAFDSCDALTEITIPYGVTRIGEYAFSRCSALTKIVIPDSVTSIGNGAFLFCSSLEEITIPDSVISIGSSAFSSCSALTRIALSNNLSSIETDTFSYCDALTEIIIPEHVTSIGQSAFCECRSLAKAVIPDSVTYIGYEAFRDCSALSGIELPRGLERICESSFYGCANLAYVQLPQSVREIDSSAFYGCDNLTAVALPDGIVRYGNSPYEGYSPIFSDDVKVYARIGSKTADAIAAHHNEFYDGYYGVYAYPGKIDKEFELQFDDGLWDESVTTLVIPEGITAIRDGYLKQLYFPNMTGIVIPLSVNSIGYNVDLIDGISSSSYGTIYCYQDSYAETWAKKYGYKIVLLDGFDWKNLRLSLPKTVRLDLDTPAYLDRMIVASPALPCEYDPATLVYASSDESVLTIDAQGRMEGKRLGSATVSVSLAEYPNARAETTVNVVHLPKCVSLPEVIIVPAKASYSLLAQEITFYPEDAEALMTWVSDNPDIAKVDANGVITGVSIGKTTLTARTENNLVAKTTVSVIPRISSLVFTDELGRTDAELAQYETLQLYAKSHSGSQSFTNRFAAFSSSNPAVATIDENGLVTARGEGTATIMATITDTLSASFSVRVRGYQTLKLPEGLRTIEPEAFAGCAAEAIVIPASVSAIGENAFADCPNIVLIINHSAMTIDKARVGLAPEASIIK